MDYRVFKITWIFLKIQNSIKLYKLNSVILTDLLSQIRYLLVVILGLNSVSGVQYKGVMTDR